MGAINRFYQTYGFGAVVAALGVIIFFINLILHAISPTAYGNFAINTGLTTQFEIFIYKPWTLFTYPMVLPIGNLIIALFEILIFWSFTNIFRQMLGAEKERRFILFSWLIIPIPVLLIGALMPGNTMPFLFGFTTVTLAVLGACITVAPQLPLMLYGIIRIPLIWLGLAMIVIEIASYRAWTTSPGIAAMIAPLIGFAYVKLLRQGTDITTWLNFEFLKSRGPKARKSSIRVVHSRMNPGPEVSEMDQLLDKISEVGYENLTRSEKEALNRFGGKDSDEPSGTKK
jgi:hypothetical protein